METMKFLVKSQSFRGGDYSFSMIKVEDSNNNEIYEKHLWWHDDKIHIEEDEDTLNFLMKVYTDLNIRKFGLTDYEDYNDEIIKDYSDEDHQCFIIPYEIAKSYTMI
jgi:hypothetical protein